MLHIPTLKVYSLGRKKLLRSATGESTRAPVHLRLEHDDLLFQFSLVRGRPVGPSVYLRSSLCLNCPVFAAALKLERARRNTTRHHLFTKEKGAGYFHIDFLCPSSKGDCSRDWVGMGQETLLIRASGRPISLIAFCARAWVSIRGPAVGYGKHHRSKLPIPSSAVPFQN